MKSTFAVSFVFILLSGAGFAERVNVTGDSVNIRAASNLTSRVMGQVQRDTVLDAVSIDDAWVGILPPPDIFGWIHEDLVKNGQVSVPRANVRSGPGINYEAIARVEKNTILKVHGTFSNWLKVTPPEGTVVWVSRDFVAPLAQPVSTTSSIPQQVDLLTNSSANVGIAPKPPMPEDVSERVPSPSVNIPEQPLSASGLTSNMLVATADQDVQVSRTGILKKASLVWRRPSRYVLIADGDGQDDKVICYVTGSDPQLEAVLGRKMTVDGKEYTVQGAKYPVLSARKIILH